MRREVIERIVNGLDQDLGPDVDVLQIEKEAERQLSRLQDRPSTDGGNQLPLSPCLPVSVPVNIRLDDCSGRLAPSVVSHAYDKIRRLSSGLPHRLAEISSTESQGKPRLPLVIHGTEELLRPFSGTSVIDICQAIEQAAIDCGFDAVNLLFLKAGKGASATRLLSDVPGILRVCTHSTIELEVGSSTVGMRAAELISSAETFLHLSKDERRRLIFSVNGGAESGVFQDQTAPIRIDVHVSVWPVLDALADAFTEEICYGDRFTLLGEAGRLLLSSGTRLLERLSATAFSGYDGKGRVNFSIDHEADGPQRLGLYTGMHPTVPAGAMTSGASSLTVEGLRSQIPRSTWPGVFSDGILVTDTLRPVTAYLPDVQNYDLAGYFVDTFAGAVAHRYSRWIKLVGIDPPDGIGMSERSDIRSIVQVIHSGSGWSSAQFERGGAIIPPAAS